jgi:serine/threonine protein phosphatase PrpC
VHAGDSRVYHFRNGRVVFRTMDHSYVQTLVNQGELSEQEALDHPHANILMGCLGTENDPPVDLHVVPQLTPGDALMACSDGVWHYFTPEELASTIAMLSPREACEFLIQKARTRAKGAGDNLSIVIVKLEPLS